MPFVTQFLSYDIYSLKKATGKNNRYIYCILDCKYENKFIAIEQDLSHYCNKSGLNKYRILEALHSG